MYLLFVLEWLQVWVLFIKWWSKRKRFAVPNAEVMIHQPLGGTRGQATDIQIHAEHILRIKNE